MASPTTALELIRRSMLLAKLLQSGETPTAEEAADALATLNDVLENWDNEPLSLWCKANETFNTVAAQATYTIGPAGDFNTTRPRAIDGAYVTLNGTDSRVDVVGQLQYNDAESKAQTGTPNVLLYVADYPLGRITLWPVPSAVMPLVLTFDRLLTQIPDLATVIDYPPGGMPALRYALAVELAVEYGSPLDVVTAALAAEKKADFKRANKRPIKTRFDAALL